MLDLVTIESEEELEALGPDKLRAELGSRGMKVGGTVKERARRLWLARGVPIDQLDAALLAPKPKKPRTA